MYFLIMKYKVAYNKNVYSMFYSLSFIKIQPSVGARIVLKWSRNEALRIYVCATTISLHNNFEIYAQSA